MSDIFLSERLIYRGIEDTDDPIFQRLISDKRGYANSNYTNIRLPTKQDAVKYRKFCAEECSLGAIICLAPPPAATSTVPEHPAPNPAQQYPATTTPVHNQQPTLAPQQQSQQPAEPIPIGEIHLKSPGKDRYHHRASEIGLQILPEFQGKGYGTEAIHWAVGYCFWHAGLHRVGIQAFSWNVGALRLYKRCGFVVEGREREAAWWNGRWWDLVTMGILEHEWRQTENMERFRFDERR